MTLLETYFADLPGQPLAALQATDQRWWALRHGQLAPVTVVQPGLAESMTPDFDLAVMGGTLGILLATALQQRGWRVLVLERGPLRGRAQEWNISRQELRALLELELLTETELETAIASEYNPGRLSFHQGYELWVRDVLNVGVDPVYLLEQMKQKFLQAGGQLLEYCAFEQALIQENGVTLHYQGLTGKGHCTTRLLVDAMGHFSPIVQQLRQGTRPDAICLVVGTCAQGYDRNDTGDIIASFTPILHQCQYFWEAFPARDGRTTYLFTYLDAEPERFSLTFLLEEYLRLLPQYQNCDLAQLTFQRLLFGFFPAYRHSPLQMPWPRMLAVGDSAGAQSPVSFGGFGAMVRHLPRLVQGIDQALKEDCLKTEDLALLQPYQPNLAVTWLFQKTMSVGLQQSARPNQINDLMSGVFQAMDRLGEPVLRPFLQDVVQFSGLAQTLPRVDPRLVLPLLPQIGLPALADWLKHYGYLGLYTALAGWGSHLPLAQWGHPYQVEQWLAAWHYGSGQDHLASATQAPKID
ncbi:FAD-binding oxidoreductase [Synechocystis sp. LKSZ1]|uniref:FAD-binding oxidoreductase n=1 Tax=Synechocystis sp. LKSZ1 TaxID=3144951 RepID=UPI00336BBED2